MAAVAEVFVLGGVEMFEKLRPVMQMQVGYNVVAADGRKVVGSVYLTIHATGK